MKESEDACRDDSADAYAPISAAMRRWNEPVARLLAVHDEFVLQNLMMINHAKTQALFRRSVKNALSRQIQTEDQCENN